VFLHFTVLGKPVGTNNAYRRRGNAAGFYLTKDAVAFKDKLKAHAIKAVAEQKWSKPDAKKYCLVAITVWNSPRFDVDSPTKFILDSLQGVVYDNDRCVRQVIACRESDKSEPRVEISVRYS
jgi:Holliday junction resolvase RusA-like endonuclease